MGSISIITICFNNLAELQTTCASVDAQVTPPFEHWIIDGSKTSDIRNWLEHHPQPDYRKWVCEPDRGIGDAFNKGVHRARGAWINMLNSGDRYFDAHVLATIQQTIAANPNIQWLHSRYQLQRGGIWVIIGKPFEAGKLYRGMRSLSHQSMFVRRALHDQYGLYDIQLRNAMDYDFVCRIAHEPLFFVDQALVVFAPGGATDQHYLRSLQETRQVYEKHFGFSWKLVVWQARLKSLYYIMKSPVGPALYRMKVKLKLENA
jgi:glycosyltransferase involved in cell wall biosynthesis